MVAHDLDVEGLVEGFEQHPEPEMTQLVLVLCVNDFVTGATK